MYKKVKPQKGIYKKVKIQKDDRKRARITNTGYVNRIWKVQGKLRR